MVVESHKDAVSIKTRPINSLSAARCQAGRPTGTVVASSFVMQRIKYFVVIGIALQGSGGESSPSVGGILPVNNPSATVDLARTRARAMNGTYIAWREHIIDDTGISGIAGSDGLELGDLDGDGNIDIVSVHEADTSYGNVVDGHVRVAFGSKDVGRWDLTTLIEGESAAAPEDVAIGDLNRDGYPDVMVASELAHLVYLQNPGGAAARTVPWRRLILPMTLDRGSYIRVFFADLDADGRLEVVAANKGAQNPRMDTTQLNAISWFEVKGDPLLGTSWKEHEMGRVRIPINSRPIDFDGDGDLDVFAGSRGEIRVFWYENVGKSEISFVERAIRIADTTVPNSERIANRPLDGRPLITGSHVDFSDLNHDGRMDVVLQEESNLVWLEQPERPLEAWPIHLIGTNWPDTVTGIELADIDGDGDLDAMTGSYSADPRDRDGDGPVTDRLGRLAWFENPGDARQQWTRHDISRRRRGMFDQFAALDLDSDGDLDFVSTRANSVPFDGVFWLEQLRSDSPLQSFTRARIQDSQEVPLP